MFRRLFAAYALLFTVVLGANGCVALVLAESRETRTWLATLTLMAATAGLLGTFFLSLHLARRLAAHLDELARAVEALAAAGPGQQGQQGQQGADAPRSPNAYKLGARAIADQTEEMDQLGQTIRLAGARLAERIARLEEDRRQLRTILSGMVEGVVALDAEERILYANDRAAELLELPSPVPVGRRFWEVVRQRRLLDVVRQAIERPEPAREEIVWNGAARSLTVHAARLPADRGVDTPRSPRALFTGAVLVVHDTTELRRLERLRREFAANVSHELKTPLSVIKACVETLIDGAAEEPEHRGRFLERIAQQSDRLHSLILDLLSLARIESGNELLELQPVALAPVVDACRERFSARAEARGQQLSVHSEDGQAGPPITAWADEEALEQILDNLVDNALKYTPEGGRVHVRWRTMGEQVQIEVADTGIGIPEQDLPRIFERFYRVDKARSRELGGTGLGLSIVKHLTQALRGTVSARSRVGQGTTFTVTLPRAVAP